METSRSTQRDRVFRFGPFELSEHDAELRKSGVRIKLQDQPLRVLVELVANAGKVIGREELQQKLWHADTFVDFDVGLNNAIRKLRQALGDEADNPHYIETLARRGYRFLAQVSVASPVQQNVGPAAAITGLPNSEVAQGLSAEPAIVESSSWRSNLRLWQLAVAGIVLLVLGVGIAWWLRPAASQVLTEQRVTANPPEAPITAAVISPDGKYVAYSDSTGVYIRHIDSGETRPLQLPKDFNAVPTSWFPDGTHLLLSTGDALHPIVSYGPAAVGSLWRVSLLGGSPQKLIDDGYGGAVSPDGSKIAFLHGDVGESREIWVMGSDGSNPEKVVEVAVPEEPAKPANETTHPPITRVFLSSVAWSPDGTRLSYVRTFETERPGPSEDRHSLETVGINGRTPKVVKVSRQLLPVVCWAADSRLLFGYRDDPTDDRENYGIWSIQVSLRSGERVGKEVQLTNGRGTLGGLSVSADGKRLVLLRENLFPSVFLTELDSGTRRFTRPRRLTLDENPNVATAWTSDSRAVLFISNRSGAFKVFRQAIDQAVPEVLVEGRNMFQPRLTPDGMKVLYLAGYDPDAPAMPVSVMAVPVAGGVPQVVLKAPYIGDIQCTRSPANICLLVSTTRQLAFAFDPDNGKIAPFSAFHGPSAENWSLSPDGSQLALVYRGSKHKITIVKVSDDSRREVELRETLAGGMDWSADGKTLFVTARTANGSPVLLEVEPSGNYRVMLEGDRATQYWWALPSPDGNYWALQEAAGEANVWMVENY